MVDSKRYSEKPPCSHNEWDNIRFKNMIVTLRCRVCREQWKTLNVSLRKCAAFYERKCPNGPKCELTHIHRYKHTREMCVKSINSMNAEADGALEVYHAKPCLNIAVPPPSSRYTIWSSDVWEEESSKWDQWDPRKVSRSVLVATR
eukprot:TRINITY_DN9624_c0_g1_i2.p1 TRINITY_DN9624_c0_g1~~TRINITY_DN9624_c0_g1_i2.p1  ORF type:complete len:146 (+),score=33.87 TRINITY_DN9624_c0_g1_i2:73-510(+)